MKRNLPFAHAQGSFHIRVRCGFTLIEVLVAMALVMMVAGLGVSVSSQTTKRQTVLQSAELLAQGMRLARENAVAGKKDTVNCGTNSLDGWQVVVLSSGYIVRGKCGAVTFFPSTVTYTSSIVTNSTTGTVLFKPLGQGTGGAFTTNVVGSGVSQTVSVTTSGEVRVK